MDFIYQAVNYYTGCVVNTKAPLGGRIIWDD